MTSVVQSLQSENRQGANPDGFLEQPNRRLPMQVIIPCYPLAGAK
jgi:hypothetical protein